MAKINRYTGNYKPFGANSQGTERTIFEAPGATDTQSDTLDDNINTDYLRGWGDNVVGPSQHPTRQQFNAGMFTLGQTLAYLHQHGVPEWDALQEYNSDSVTQKNGIIFASKIDANIGNNPETDSLSWSSISSQEFGTVADMKSKSLAGNSLARTLGKLSIGDGEFQHYLILTPADFGGTPDEVKDHTLANGNIAKSLYFSKQTNALANNPTFPAGVYSVPAEGFQTESFLVNEYGYQEPDTLGRLVGSYPPSNIPPGQTRLARTGIIKDHTRIAHLGEGDCYCRYDTAVISRHPRFALVDFWSGQNSAGVYSGQINAGTNQVNLYGIGDVSLSDKGYDDVSMFGQTLFLSRDGADSAGYGIPRYGSIVSSSGTNPIDCGFVARGAMDSAFDASAMTSGDAAFVMSGGHRIYLDATPIVPQVSGKFSSKALGDSFISKILGYIGITTQGNETARIYGDRVEIRPSSQNAFAMRIYGGVTSAFCAIGQLSLRTIISAASSGADDTVLELQTSSAGVESTKLKIGPSGIINISNAPTYADDAAAGVGGLVSGDVYKTASGELRIKL